MAKQRFVNTRFWSDNFIVGLESIERYLFLYFLTNEHTNICGTYELPMRTMLYETGMGEKELKKALVALTEKIIYIDGWVHVKNFERHQVARGSEKVQKGVASAKKEVPADIWKKIENYSNTKPKKYRVSNPTDSISTLDSDSDLDLDIDSDPNLALAIAHADIVSVFDIFKPLAEPNYGNKTQRSAIEELIKSYGLPKTLAAAKFAVAIQSEKYAPVITNPYQLKTKFGELVAFKARQDKNGTKSLVAEI